MKDVVLWGRVRGPTRQPLSRWPGLRVTRWQVAHRPSPLAPWLTGMTRFLCMTNIQADFPKGKVAGQGWRGPCSPA